MMKQFEKLKYNYFYDIKLTHKKEDGQRTIQGTSSLHENVSKYIFCILQYMFYVDRNNIIGRVIKYRVNMSVMGILQSV